MENNRDQGSSSSQKPMTNGTGSSSSRDETNNTNDQASSNQQDQQQQQHQQPNSQQTHSPDNQSPSPINSQSVIHTPQDVHTREKLFDFIALLQGRRMDDQRALLKPSNAT